MTSSPQGKIDRNNDFLIPRQRAARMAAASESQIVSGALQTPQTVLLEVSTCQPDR